MGMATCNRFELLVNLEPHGELQHEHFALTDSNDLSVPIRSIRSRTMG